MAPYNTTDHSGNDKLTPEEIAERAAKDTASDEEIETPMGTAFSVGTESTHEKAQEIADATGVKYEQMAVDRESDDRDYTDYNAAKVGTKLDENIGFQDSGGYINQATDTILGQLSTMGDTDFAKQQERIAKDNAGSRGLINSTMAEQAGREAWIGASFDIAKNDANTYAEFSKAKQTAEYNMETIQGEAIISGEMIEQEAKIKQSDQKVADAFDARIKGASAQDQVWLNDLQDRYNKTSLDINNKAAQMITEMQLDAQREADLFAAVRQIQQDNSIFIENILTNPTMLELGGDALNKIIDDGNTRSANEIRFVGDVAGIDLDYAADAYFDSIVVDEGDIAEEEEVQAPSAAPPISENLATPGSPATKVEEQAAIAAAGAARSILI